MQGVGGTWVLTEHGLGSSRRTWLGLDGCRSATVSGRGDWEELPCWCCRSEPRWRVEGDDVAVMVDTDPLVLAALFVLGGMSLSTRQSSSERRVTKWDDGGEHEVNGVRH